MEKKVLMFYREERWFLTVAATVLRHKNWKWDARENLNTKTADIHIQVFGTFKLFFDVSFFSKEK